MIAVLISKLVILFLALVFISYFTSVLFSDKKRVVRFAEYLGLISWLIMIAGMVALMLLIVFSR